MKAIVMAALLTVAVPVLAQAQGAPARLVDGRPGDERRSHWLLESYRTQVSLADDAMEPPPVRIFEHAIQAGGDGLHAPMVLKSLGLRISIPPAATSAQVYRALNVPDGPPNVSALVQAISASLPVHPGASALVVCEAEVVLDGKEYRALVRESYPRGLATEDLVAAVKQAAGELLAEARAAR
ncbi:hypothetical protein [Ideonella sp.]|uniref:hypothetical protein n=1 Tax=Ideonella sp. TaxID=1929293 RepID=UPI0035AF3239